MARTKTTAEEAAKWAAAEFERRTVAVARGDGPVGWIDPSSRVMWSEVLAAGFPLKMVDDREAFHEEFKRLLGRRGLVMVLRHKLSASEWLARRMRGRSWEQYQHEEGC